MDLYEKNITVLDSINPSLASLVAQGHQALHYEIFMDENHLESLNLVHNQTFKPLYTTNPQDFITEQKTSFIKFQEYPYLYFFGIGNGVLLKDLLSNPKHQRIVVIEPDPLIIYVVFHLIDFTQELLDKRLVLFGSEQVNFPTIASLFRETHTQRYARVYDLYIMSPYYDTFTNLIQETNHLFIEAIHHTIVLAGNDAKDALIGLKHHVTNMTFIPTTPPLYDLLDKDKTTDVAVLVSTGPSLGKQLESLKKIVPYVTIFAVDASLPILIQNGIKPDVITSIERVSLTARFFKAVPKEKMHGIVTVLSSLQHVDVINSVQGGQTIMSIRPLGYMRLTGPKEWGYIGIGMSAANMAYELIYHSKFKTCILIGQDLAYAKDGKSHASGHVFGESEVKQSDLDGWTTAYGGQGKVKTTAVWNMFRGFFEKDIEEAKDRMLTINATEGGAQIFGAQELPFARALALHVKKAKPKKAIILQALEISKQQIVLQRSMRKLEEIEHYIKTQQTRTEALFLEVATLCDKPDFEYNVAEESLAMLLEKIALFRETFKEEIFDKVIWHIAQTMLLVQEIAIAPMEVMYTPDDTSQKIKYKNLLLAYKGWLFSLAGCMDAIVKTITYAKARSLIYTVDTIDVILDDQKIDTITCKTMKAQNGRVFDVDMRGILYDVPDGCIGKQVVFKDAITCKELPKTFVNSIERNDEAYNRLRFMASLEEPVDEEKIKDMYCPNVIGFLATKENLEDEAFVEYMNKLMIDFSQCTFKALYIDRSIKTAIMEKFDNIESVLLTDITDIFLHIEVYLSNYERAYLENIENKIVQFLRCYSTDVSCLGLALNAQNISIREHENSHPLYFNKFFDNLVALGFDQTDSEQYGTTFYEIYYKKASEQYGVDIHFDLNQNLSRAYVYWNLELGLKSHEFFKTSIQFVRKMIKLYTHG